jgi:UDP-galactopyranose mutase
MGRLTIPVNFDNHPELYEYVVSKGNKGDFIRNCIKKEKDREEVDRHENKDLENMMERVIKRCLQEYSPPLDVKNTSSISSDVLQAAASFFDED